MIKKNIWLFIVLVVIIILVVIYFFIKPYSEIINLDKTEFVSGEIINFHIKTKHSYNSCNSGSSLPYSIYKENGDYINQRYNCNGFAGVGVNQYCRNGVIEFEETVHCSDDCIVGEIDVDGNYSWNQTELIDVSEECDGRTIHRQEPRQVENGVYTIKVGNVEKSFLIK
jgi:hypothetical protein